MATKLGFELGQLGFQGLGLMKGLGFRVEASGFRLQGYKASGLGLRVPAPGFGLQGLGFRV